MGKPLRAHTDWVNCLTGLPNGRHALSASRDATLILWDLEQETSLSSLKVESPITAIAPVSECLVMVGDAQGRVYRIEVVGV